MMKNKFIVVYIQPTGMIDEFKTRTDLRFQQVVDIVSSIKENGLVTFYDKRNNMLAIRANSVIELKSVGDWNEK